MIQMKKLLISTPEKSADTPQPPTDQPTQPETPKTAYKFEANKKYTEYAPSYKNSIQQAGTVVKETYNGINGSNSLNVYLPYGYDKNKKYNVFYFMHGMGDNENSLFYNDNGEMQRVFDNMIKNGDIELADLLKTDPFKSIDWNELFGGNVEPIKYTVSVLHDAIAA